MRTIVRRGLVGLLIASVFFPPACADTFSDPLEIGVGARAMALGRAFTAHPADVSAVFFNPASLSTISSPALGWMQTQLFSSVNYFVGMGVLPLPAGTIGLGYSGALIPGIPVTQLVTINGQQRPQQVDTTQFGNHAVVLSYARELRHFFNHEALRKVSVGAALKYYLTRFEGGGAGVAGAGGSGYDLDLGLTWAAHPWLMVGFVQRNVLPASLGGEIRWSGGRAATSIGMATRIGAHAVLLDKKDSLWEDDSQRISVGLDAEWGYREGKPLLLHWGMEWRPFSLLTLRLGMDQQPKPLGAGFAADSALTTGIGLRLAGFEFDYAFRPFGDIAENAAHFFSVSYDFSKAVVRTLDSPEWAEVPAPKPAVPSAEAEPLLLESDGSFVDVAKSHFAYEAIQRLSQKKILGGYPDRTFRPEKAVNRAEFVAVLLKSVGISPERVSRESFLDVASVHWAAGYIQAAVDRQIASGYPGGVFHPQHSVTRAEGISMMAKLMDKRAAEDVRIPYTDITEFHWAYPALQVAYRYDLLGFIRGDRFRPAQPLTRSELAWMLSKLQTP